MRRPVLVASVLILAMAAPAAAQVSVPSNFVEEAFINSLSNPVAIAFAPDGRVFVGEQAGTVRIYSSTGASLGTFHAFANVDMTQERGLLGLALDPSFATNGYVYAYVTRSVPTMHNEVVRITASGDASTGTETVILALEDVTNSIHNAGCLRFGLDGCLYISVGDNGPMANAQSLTSRFGKILRINADGSIPSDNPTSFTVLDAAGNASVGSTSGIYRSIWAIGLRNPFRFNFQPGTGRMFINDVGQATWEEINDGIAGANYGWRATGTDGTTANANDRDPIYAYGHSGTTPLGQAITGGTFYNPVAPAFPAGYVGQYFFSDYLGGGWIYTCNPSTGSVAPFATGLGLSSIVDLAVGNDGALYLVRRNGNVRRIRYTGVLTQALVVSATSLEVNEGASGTFGVRLAADPGPAPITVDVTAGLGDGSVSVTGGGALTFTSANWASFQNVTVGAAHDADTSDDGRTIQVSAAGLASLSVIATAMDDDRAPGAPRAVINQPANGQTTGGASAEFFGEGFDNSTTLRAEFYVDGVLVYAEPNTVGHYHIHGGHGSWDTTSLSNGVHVLRLVVFDDSVPELSGAHEITVVIDNPPPPSPSPAPSGPSGDDGGGGKCGLTGIETVIVLLVAGAWRRRRGVR